ncbi:hypothetical protein [Paenibacillus sp. yr247]|uniref:hypothetical protein n=1 Tax=Paenibacillus sp. yr247 TaxID=1761880 RepID=UPI0020C8354C|nr:hypothetical protein [Paenibacillus sp. yr247]
MRNEFTCKKNTQDIGPDIIVSACPFGAAWFHERNAGSSCRRKCGRNFSPADLRGSRLRFVGRRWLDAGQSGRRQTGLPLGQRVQRGPAMDLRGSWLRSHD